MNYSKIMLAINEVLLAQYEKDLESVISRRPELLEERTLMTLMEMAEQSRQNNQQETFKALKIVLNKISSVLQAKLRKQRTQIETEFTWAVKMRKHLALRNSNLLDEAIDEAKSEPEIASYLRAFQQNDSKKINQLSHILIAKFKEENHDEEALTTYLILIDSKVFLLENYNKVPFENQKEAFEKGFQANQQALFIAEILQDESCKAFYFNVIGNGFYQSRQFEEAEQYYNKGLEIYKKLAEKQPQIFLHKIASILYNLGIVQDQQTNWEVASRFYREALKIYKQLAEKEPNIFLEDVAMTLTNLGDTQCNQREFLRAETYFIESLQIIRNLAKNQPDVFLKDVATTLNSLGNTQINQRKILEAETSYIEAVKIYTELAEKEPHIFLRELIAVLTNVGRIKFEQRNLIEAEKSCTEALKICKNLAKVTPNMFLSDLMSTNLDMLGNIHTEQRNFSKAEESFVKSLQIIRKLAETEPHIYLEDVAITTINIGKMQTDQRKYFDAETHLNEALQVVQKLVEMKPDIFLPLLAAVYNNLGYVQFDQRKLDEAEESFTKALQIRKNLAKKEPHIFLKDVAISLNNLGGVQNAQKKRANAELSYSEGLQIFQHLAEIEPHIFLKDVAMTFSNLGLNQREQKKLSEAEDSYNKALEIRESLAKKEPHIFLQYLALTQNNLGLVQEDKRNVEAAEESFKKALIIYKNLAEKEPHIFLKDVAMTLNNLGANQFNRRKFSQAEEYYKESLLLRRNLAETEPHIFNRDVAMTLSNLGFVKIETDLHKAEKYFVEAVSLISSLQEGAITADDKNRLMQENLWIYNGLLTYYIKIKDWQKVLEIAETSKSRSLTDFLNLKSEDLQPKSSNSDTLATVKNLGKRYSDILKKLQQLVSFEKYLSKELNQIEGQKTKTKDDNYIDDETKLGLYSQIDEQKQSLSQKKQEAEQKRFKLQSELKTVLVEINKYDNDFPPKAFAIKPEDIIRISENLKRVIIMFRVFRESTAIIAVFPDGKLQVEEILNFGINDLIELHVNKWLNPYRTTHIAHSEYKIAEKELADSSEQYKAEKRQIYEEKFRAMDKSNEDWENAIIEVLKELDEKLIFKVREMLDEKTDIKDVLFIPNHSLALLPLHAACRDENGENRYFLEDYNVSYCPNVSVFKRCMDNEKLRSEKTLGIITPTEDLMRYETEQIQMLNDFNNESIKLIKDAATKENVLKALNDDNGVIHFYCHGKYNEGNPFDSGLVMADGVLKLSEIMNNNLQANWLTVLSACETGMVDAFSVTDEHFGLPLGFVFAGSPSVWASLWSVNAVTTSNLMQKAYQNLNKEEYKNNKSEALRQAQLEMSKDKNFSHPFYWAGFQHFGV